MTLAFQEAVVLALVKHGEYNKTDLSTQAARIYSSRELTQTGYLKVIDNMISSDLIERYRNFYIATREGKEAMKDSIGSLENATQFVRKALYSAGI